LLARDAAASVGHQTQWHGPYTAELVADLPLTLEPELAARLAGALDVEGKIPRAFEALAPVAGAKIVLLDGSTGDDGRFAAGLAALGAHVTVVADEDGAAAPDLEAFPGASADIIVSAWSSFRSDLPAALAAAGRVLRAGGRLLVLHDYGRDDVSRLRPSDLPEYTTWSKRDGWFLRSGFKVRVIHCWWTFESIEQATAFLGDAFGDAGVSFAATLKRPRLSYNVAIYHWTNDTRDAA